MTRRVLAALLVALVAVGCGERAPTGDVRPEGFQLLTGEVPRIAGRCFGTGVGVLLADAEHGTAMRVGLPPIGDQAVMPVAWRPGFTARQLGSEVQVFDTEGQLVAVTGKSYRYWSVGTVGPGPHWVGVPLPEVGAFWICGDVSLDPASN